MKQRKNKLWTVWAMKRKGKRTELFKGEGIRVWICVFSILPLILFQSPIIFWAYFVYGPFLFPVRFSWKSPPSRESCSLSLTRTVWHFNRELFLLPYSLWDAAYEITKLPPVRERVFWSFRRAREQPIGRQK
jgi:hypothetical protein